MLGGHGRTTDNEEERADEDKDTFCHPLIISVFRTPSTFFVIVSTVTRLIDNKMNMSREKMVDVAFVLLRVVAGLLFLQHGGQKIFGWFGSGMSIGALPTLIVIAGLLETIGGLLIVVGAFVRPVAFILSGEMAVAYFMAHFAKGFWPIQNGGEAAALFAFIFLFLAAQGAGKWSIDDWMKNRKMGVQQV